jgi:hypothetical protein
MIRPANLSDERSALVFVAAAERFLFCLAKSTDFKRSDLLKRALTVPDADQKRRGTMRHMMPSHSKVFIPSFGAACCPSSTVRRNSLVSRLFGLLGLVLVAQQAAAGPITVFSASSLYRSPETISQAPASFGAFGGDYFIPDFNRAALNGNIWRVPAAGGPPTSFATNADYASLGGVFLPDTGWGTNSGKFLATGSGAGLGVIYTYASDGTRTAFVPGVATFQPSEPRLAPAGFGVYGGQLIVANSAGREVIAFTPTGMASIVASPFVSPFGLGFAPAGFGALGGDLFVTNGATNEIDVIRGDGTVSPFATIPLLPGQVGLRQIEFSPSGFLPGLGASLFVSVSGSASGGGTLGDVVALDSSGKIVADLRTDLGLAKFDPRGLFFVDNQHLLISDASDPILLATPDAFQGNAAAVPEPSTFVMSSILFGVFGAVWSYKRLKKAEPV